MVERLAALQREFTIVSAYLQCPDKNPSVFIEVLKQSFRTDRLAAEKSETILAGLNQIWGICVKDDPQLPFSSVAPHVFLCAIHAKPDLWHAKLALGSGS